MFFILVFLEEEIFLFFEILKKKYQYIYIDNFFYKVILLIYFKYNEFFWCLFSLSSYDHNHIYQAEQNIQTNK